MHFPDNQGIREGRGRLHRNQEPRRKSASAESKSSRLFVLMVVCGCSEHTDMTCTITYLRTKIDLIYTCIRNKAFYTLSGTTPSHHPFMHENTAAQSRNSVKAILQRGEIQLWTPETVRHQYCLPNQVKGAMGGAPTFPYLLSQVHADSACYVHDQLTVLWQ